MIPLGILFVFKSNGFYLDFNKTIWYVKDMKAKIILEMTEFLKRNPMPIKRLAEEAGVAAPTLTRVLTGERDDMYSRNADKIREAMLKLSTPTTQPEGEEAGNG